MLCPRCNSENEPGAKFCKFCNAPLKDLGITPTNVKVKNKNRFNLRRNHIQANGNVNDNSNKIYRRNKIGGIFSFLISFIILAIILVAIFFLCLLMINKLYENADNYKVGNDKIPSIKYILGSRELKNIDYKFNNATLERVYNYENVPDVTGDLNKYIAYLMQNQGFNLLSEFNNTPTGSVKLAAVAQKAFEDVIVLEINWTENSYSLYFYNDKDALENP